jgi:putative transposase
LLFGVAGFLHRFSFPLGNAEATVLYFSAVSKNRDNVIAEGIRTMKKRFTEAQIVGFLREADAGVAIKDLCRKHGFSDGSYYLWRSKFGGMSVSDAKRLKELETENARLKKLLAESHLEIEVTREVLRKKW